MRPGFGRVGFIDLEPDSPTVDSTPIALAIYPVAKGNRRIQFRKRPDVRGFESGLNSVPSNVIHGITPHELSASREEGPR